MNVQITSSPCPLSIPCSILGGCLHSDFKECRLYLKILSNKKGKKWKKGVREWNRTKNERAVRKHGRPD